MEAGFFVAGGADGSCSPLCPSILNSETKAGSREVNAFVEQRYAHFWTRKINVLRLP